MRADRGSGGGDVESAWSAGNVGLILGLTSKHPLIVGSRHSSCLVGSSEALINTLWINFVQNISSKTRRKLSKQPETSQKPARNQPSQGFMLISCCPEEKPQILPVKE